MAFLRVLITVAVFLLVTAGTVVAQSTAERSVRDTVYSETQAERGAVVYRDACLECHEVSEFAGGNLISVNAGSNLGELFVYLRANMPFEDPGRLRPRQYADVLAYLLSVNGFPAGNQDLPSDPAQLVWIRIEQPVRSNQ